MRLSWKRQMVHSDEEKEKFKKLCTRLIVEIRRCKIDSLEDLKKDLVEKGVIKGLRVLPIPGNEHKFVLGFIDLMSCTTEHRDTAGNAYLAMQRYYDERNGRLLTPHQKFDAWYALTFCKDRLNSSFAVDAWRGANKKVLEAYNLPLGKVDLSFDSPLVSLIT